MVFLYQNNGKFREEKNLRRQNTCTQKFKNFVRLANVGTLRFRKSQHFREFLVEWEEQSACGVLQSSLSFFALTVSACPSQQNKTNRIKLIWHYFKGFFDSFPKSSEGFSFCHFATEIIIQKKDYRTLQPWSTQFFTNEALKMTTWVAITTRSFK